MLYKIPRVVIGENRSYLGAEEYLRAQGIELEIKDDPECIELMKSFMEAHPQLWKEDIGI